MLAVGLGSRRGIIVAMNPTERAHERIHQRHSIELDVEIALEDGSERVGRSVDVGLGGMRLTVSPPLAFGARVTLRFRLPSLPQRVEVVSIVRWVDAAGTAGVQFGSLRAREVWALNQLFRKRSQ